MAQREMDPNTFENFCIDAGAENFYRCIKDATCHGECHTNRNICDVQLYTYNCDNIYCDVLTISKFNSFQVVLSRTLEQFGISNEGIESLRNLGIAAHPATDSQSFNNSMPKLSKTYAENMPDRVVAKYFDPEAEADY